jgi:hypothetical protein
MRVLRGPMRGQVSSSGANILAPGAVANDQDHATRRSSFLRIAESMQFPPKLCSVTPSNCSRRKTIPATSMNRVAKRSCSCRGQVEGKKQSGDGVTRYSAFVQLGVGRQMAIDTARLEAKHATERRRVTFGGLAASALPLICTLNRARDFVRDPRQGHA